MKIIELFRFIPGYISFAAIGGFSDRFINLCSRKSVTLFNVMYKKNCVYASVPIKHIYKLKSICKKSGVRLELKSEHGLYFLLKKYNHRIGLPIGLVFYIVFCMIMQQFVWAIDIQNSNNVSQQEIADLLKVNGLDFGTRISRFDEIYCSRKTVNSLTGKIQWMAININGSKAFVELHDYNEIKKGGSYKEPSNIVADFDGILLSIDAYNGEAVANPGNGVSKGDLLISGIVENRDFSVSYFDAKGKATAMHEVNINKNFNITEKFKKIENRYTKKSAIIFGVKIPLYISFRTDESQIFTNTSYVCIDENVFPFGFTEDTYLTHSEKIVAVNEEQLALLKLENYNNYVYKKLSCSTIINYKTVVSRNNDSYAIETKYSCIDFIGEKQLINLNIF